MTWHERLNKMRTLRHSNGGQELCLGFRDLGCRHGRPVLFLHAANQTGASWGDFAALLPDHRAICPDLPGTGLSHQRPFDTLESAAEAVAATVRTCLPGQRLPIAGISLGAYVGLLLAIRHPDVVASAVLSGFQVAPLPAVSGLLLMGAVLSLLMTTYAFRKKMARSFGLDEGSAAWPTSKAPCSAATLRKVNRAVVRFDAKSALCRIEAPVIALAGEREAVPVLEAIQDMPTRTPCIQSALVEGGHAWPATRPDLFARILIHWIEDGQLPNDPNIERVFPRPRDVQH